MPLGAGSPAVDAGVAAGALLTDQRGAPRLPPPDASAVEAVELLFRYGFESGDASAWSATVPGGF
jgi:hypothetical protein